MKKVQMQGGKERAAERTFGVREHRSDEANAQHTKMDLFQQPVNTMDKGVACVAISTESPYGTRVDVTMADLVRELRQQRIPSRLFHVHLDPSDVQENRRRIERLVARVVEGEFRVAIFHEVWTKELGEKLAASGVQLIELRSHTFPQAQFVARSDIAARVAEFKASEVQHELRDLLEIVGPAHPAPPKHVDLYVGQSCGYKNTAAANPFYREVATTPEVSSHLGCAHCTSARSQSLGSASDVAERIAARVRRDRAAFPTLETIWVAFAETFYDAFAIAFEKSSDDSVWSGMTFAMQCRPDVIAQRADDLVRLGAAAASRGARMRVAVVGFENFSERELLVLNRGCTPEAVERAVPILRNWSLHPREGLMVEGYTPSLILFTPWTRWEDLECNLRAIHRHDLWQANIERLRVGEGTPVHARALHDGLVEKSAAPLDSHPHGYTSEVATRYAEPLATVVSAGFEQLKPLCPNDQAELLGAVMFAVERSKEPAAIRWEAIAAKWREMGAS